jgi:hypothetical protein
MLRSLTQTESAPPLDPTVLPPLDPTVLSRMACRAESFGQALRSKIMSVAWNGQWLRRAWLGPDDGWAGDLDLDSVDVNAGGVPGNGSIASARRTGGAGSAGGSTGSAHVTPNITTDQGMFSAQLGWALLAGVFNDEQQEVAINNLLGRCRPGSYRPAGNVTADVPYKLGFTYRCGDAQMRRPGELTA